MPHEIQLFGPIGKGFDPFSGVQALSAAWLTDELAKLGGADVELLVSSDGGDVFEGVAMGTAIARHPGHVTATVAGIAASSASFLMMPADRIVMAPGTQMMVHRAWSVAMGDSRELAKQAETLAHVDRTSVEPAYLARVNIGQERLAEMLDAETWIDAESAVAMGFADEIGAAPNTPVQALLRPQFAAKAPEGIVAMASGDYRQTVETMRDDLRLKAQRTKLEHMRQTAATMKARNFERIDENAAAFAGRK